MAQKHFKKNTLKNLPFYSEEIENSEKKNKKISNIELLSELLYFSKESKELTIKQLSDVLPFSPKRKKRSKRLTKHQILQNILPFYDSVGISRRERAFRGHSETDMLKLLIK